MIENQAFERLHQVSRGIALDYNSRVNVLNALKSWIQTHENEIYDALTLDLGKPQLEAYLSEIYFTIHGIDTAVKNLKKWMKPKTVRSDLTNFPSRNSIVPTPKGLVLIISTWNYPFHLSVTPLVEAIAAGNRVILKPSDVAQETSKLLKQMAQSDIFKNVFEVVEGGKEVTQALVSLPFDHIFFTGGTKIGKIIATQAAQNLTPVTLELGGKNPCIVDDTVDLTVSVKRIMSSKFFNAGQTCIAPDFVWIQENIADEFLELCKSTLKNFYPTIDDWKKDSARIVSPEHFQRLIQLISDQSWSLYAHDAANLQIAPTINLNASWNDISMQDEIFGPILPMMTFRSIDDVVSKIRDGSPLALYLFSQNKETQKTVIQNSRSGGVCINDCMKQFTNAALPFGGVGQSGYGAYHAKAGFDTFSHFRSIARKSFWWDKFSAYPPYDRIFKTIRKFVK